VLLNRFEQDRHLYRFIEALSGKSALGELVNEDFKNGRLSARFSPSMLTGMPWTRSAAPDNEMPYVPGTFLDWTTHHTPRDHEWPRKAKELYDISNAGFTIEDPPGTPKERFNATELPAVAGEPIRLDEATASDYADYMAVCELFGAGGCLHGGFATKDPDHTTDLQFSIAPPPGSHGAQVAQAVSEIWALNINPELASRGHYTRGPMVECPLFHKDEWALRTFSMHIDNHAVVVVVRPNQHHQVIEQGGWRVERRVRNVFFMTR
jgi:hypothetical protein